MKEMNENIDSPMLSSEDKPNNSSKDEWIAILEHNKLSSSTFFYFFFPLIYQNFFLACVLFIVYHYVGNITTGYVIPSILYASSSLILFIVVIILKCCYKKGDIIHSATCFILHLVICLSFLSYMLSFSFLSSNKIPFFIIFTNLTFLSIVATIVSYFSTNHYYLYSMLVLVLGLPLSGIWFIYSNDKEYIIAMGITFGFVLYLIVFTSYLYNHMRVNEDDDEYRHKMNMKFYSAMVSNILPLGIVYIAFIMIMFLFAFLLLYASMGTQSRMIGKKSDYICGENSIINDICDCCSEKKKRKHIINK